MQCVLFTYDCDFVCFSGFLCQVLKLSPQNVDDSMLQLIALSKLKDFHIVQNENTPKTVTPCTAKAWTHFKQSVCRELRVHLEGIAKERNECDLLIQPEAPVYSIKCKNVRNLCATKSSDTISNGMQFLQFSFNI